jgi:hypothetical protein
MRGTGRTGRGSFLRASSAGRHALPEVLIPVVDELVRRAD